MKKGKLAFLIAPVVFGLALKLAAADADSTAPARALLALSKKDHTLAIIDPRSLKILTRVPVGPDPHEVIASSDGKTAYVSNMGGDFHEIDVIDLVAEKALPMIDTGALLGIHGLAFAGGKLWFTAQGAMAVARYNPAEAGIDWILGTGQNRTHMIYVTSDTKQIYTTNVESGTVSILEQSLRQPPKFPPGGGHGPGPGPGPGPGMVMPGAKVRLDWTQTVIPVGKGSEGFDVSPDGKELWTAAAQDGTLSIVDLGAKKLKATVQAKVEGANRLKFTPDGKRVLVSNLRSGELAVFDGVSRKEVKRLSLGHGASGILIDTDGSRAFVACTADDYVAVVDLKTLEVTSHLDVGGGPDGLAWANP